LLACFGVADFCYGLRVFENVAFLQTVLLIFVWDCCFLLEEILSGYWPRFINVRSLQIVSSGGRSKLWYHNSTSFYHIYKGLKIIMFQMNNNNRFLVISWYPSGNKLFWFSVIIFNVRWTMCLIQINFFCQLVCKYLKEGKYMFCSL